MTRETIVDRLVGTKAWMMDENITPVHHHSGDDSRNFLVDEATGDIMTEVQASEVAQKRLSRRTVMQGGMVAAMALASPSLGARAAFASTPPEHTLVIVFLRGGMDGLSVVTPWQDTTYRSKRSSTLFDPAIGNATVLNNTFALNKKMEPLQKVLSNGHLSFVHQVGVKEMGRSHFDEQLRVERSAPINYHNGWLGRYLAAKNPSDQGVMRIVNMSPGPIDALRTAWPTLTTTSFNALTINEGVNGATMVALEKLYATAGGQFSTTGKSTFDALRLAQSLVRPLPAGYTNTSFGVGLANIAQAIKKGQPIEVAGVDLSSWDHHTNVVNNVNYMTGVLATNLAAFYDDLGSSFSKVSVLAVSEFGRTTQVNSGAGVDHGRGNLVMLMSPKASTRPVVGPWAGLSPSVTDAYGDLEVLTDHRDVFAEVLTKTMGATPELVQKTFPSYTPKLVGVTR